MKLFIYIILLNLIDFTAQSQQKYLRFVENKKFEKLNDLVSESLEKNQKDLDANVGATLLYFKNDSPFFDIKKAFFYNEFSRELFQEILDTKRIEKLNELKINLDFFDVLQDSIYYKSYNQVIIDPNVEALNDYLNYYKALPQAYKNDVVRLRNKLAYEMALSKNTVSSFQEFIDTYPKAIQVQESIKRRDIIAFDLVKSTKDISLIQGFLSKYPNSELRFLAIDIRDRWAYDQAMTLNTVVGFQDFLNNYPNSKLAAQVIGFRDNRAYDQALATNTVAGYQYFLTSYPYSKFVIKVTDLRDSLAFENNSNDILGLKNYIKSYPNSKRLKDAANKLYDLEWTKTKKINSKEVYINYVTEYPLALNSILAKTKIAKFEFDEILSNFSEDNAFEYLSTNNELLENIQNDWKLAIVDTLIKIAFQNSNYDLIENGIKNFEGEIQKRFLEANYYWFTIDGEEITLNEYFQNLHENFKSDLFEPNKEADYQLAKMGDELNLYNEFNPSMIESYENYIRLAKGKERSFVAIQKIIKPDLDLKKWSNAIAKINKYTQMILSEASFLDSISPTITKLRDLKNILEKPVDLTIVAKNFGEPINSIGGEYQPTLSADDKTLYFVGQNRKNSLDLNYEDIFVSKKINDKWNSPKVAGDLSEKKSNEAVLHISSDATNLVLFINGQLTSANKGPTGWIKSSSFSEINTSDWQSDASFSSDNNALLFATTRSSNYNFSLNKLSIADQRNLKYHGESGESIDIYVTLKDEDGNWGEPINLGPTINSDFNERSPFLHADMKTLYFSSSGHGGLGSLDVYKSTRLSDTCWTCWSKPENLGKEINTSTYDWCFKINTGGNLALYSKRNGSFQDDLFSIKLPPSMRPDFVATINGKLTDSQNKIVNAQIKWEDLELNKTIGVSNVDPETGEYFIILPMGKLYGYYVDKMGYFPIANNLDLRKYNKAINIENNIKMVTLDEMKINGVSVIANNIFFETNKSELLPYSIPELERVAKILKSTDRKIEISGHTDDVGGVASNLILSNQRAESVVKYLIILGCDSSKINSKGYGKSAPIGDNKTEVGRAANRRVEVKFITL